MDNALTVRVKKLDVASEIVQASQKGLPPQDLDSWLDQVRKAYRHVYQTVEHPNAAETAD